MATLLFLQMIKMVSRVYSNIVDLSVQIRAISSVRDPLGKEMTYSQFCLSILNGACEERWCKAVGPCCRYVPDRLYQSPNAKEKVNVFRNKI